MVNPPFLWNIGHEYPKVQSKEKNCDPLLGNWKPELYRPPPGAKLLKKNVTPLRVGRKMFISEAISFSLNSIFSKFVTTQSSLIYILWRRTLFSWKKNYVISLLIFFFFFFLRAPYSEENEVSRNTLGRLSMSAFPPQSVTLFVVISRAFWSFIKNRRRDSSGIGALWNGQRLVSSAIEEILHPTDQNFLGARSLLLYHLW